MRRRSSGSVTSLQSSLFLALPDDGPCLRPALEEEDLPGREDSMLSGVEEVGCTVEEEDEEDKEDEAFSLPFDFLRFPFWREDSRSVSEPELSRCRWREVARGVVGSSAS